MSKYLDLIDKSSKYILNVGSSILIIGVLILWFFYDRELGLFFSSIFINLGLTIIIVNFFMSNLNIEIFQNSLSKSFREILGIESPNSKLLPDIMKLFRGGGYTILDSTETDSFYYVGNKNNSANMGTIEEVRTKIVANEDNVHYFFKRSSTTGNCDDIEVLELIINDENISPNDKEEFFIKKCPDCNYYIFAKKLEKGKEYDIYFKIKLPAIMSDLTFKGKNALKEDWIQIFHNQLTN